MSIMPNRSFSVPMENTNVSNYDAFKELTTNRKWNRGSIKIDYNEDRAVTALRCANHSINPFSRSEKFSEQDVKNTNDTFELAIRGEIRKLGDLAIQKAAQKAGVEIKDKKFDVQCQLINDNIQALQDKFDELVESKIKTITTFWEEKEVVQPLSRKDMEAVILEVEALRTMTDNPELLEMWTTGFNEDDMVSLRGKSNEDIADLMNDNINIAKEVEAETTTKSDQPKAAPKNVESRPTAAPQAPVEMSDLSEKELNRLRGDAKTFAKSVFGDLAKLVTDLRKKGVQESTSITKWFSSFNKKIKSKTGLDCPIGRTEGPMDLKEVLLLTRAACRLNIKQAKSLKDKVLLEELSNRLAPFKTLGEDLDAARKNLGSFSYAGGTEKSCAVVEDGLSTLKDGEASWQDWANEVTSRLKREIYSFTGGILPENGVLRGNRVKALDALAKSLDNEVKVGSTKEITKYSDQDLNLLIDVKDELLAMRGLAEKLDDVENSIDGFYNAFLEEYAK